MSKVYACIDGSIYSASVVDHAAWASARLGRALELLHVIAHPSGRPAMADLSGTLQVDANLELLNELASLDERRAKLALERGRLILDAGVQRARDAGQAEVHARQRHGELVDTLAELESEYELLVIGKRGESADFARLHLGSNLERIARASHRPVLVASREFKPIRTAVLAYDGSASANKAVELAASSALMADLELHLVTAAAETEEVRAAGARVAERFAALGRKIRVRVIAGNADAVIGDYVRAENIDLLVMGAWGHSRIRQFIVGSTTTAMMRTCLVPVLLVR